MGQILIWSSGLRSALRTAESFKAHSVVAVSYFEWSTKELMSLARMNDVAYQTELLTRKGLLKLN